MDTQNHKTLLREIQDLHKYTNILCSKIRKLNIVKDGNNPQIDLQIQTDTIWCGHGLEESIILRYQEARTYNREKISSAGKTGQLHVKE